MKNSNTQKNSGSILLATMVFVWAVAAFMVSYLLLVQNSNQSVARAQDWNSALPLAEAGIEQGLANLNAVSISTSSNSVSFGPLSGNLNGESYSVIGEAYGATNIMTSTGSTIAPITGATITRRVQISAQRQGLFSKGMISMTSIDMNGNSVVSDSWNSHDANQSLNGKYNPSYHGTNGDIAAVNGLVNIGNQTILGNLYLGPNSTFKSGPQGDVTGTIYNDWNMQFPGVTLPTPADTNGNPIAWTPAPGSTAAHTFTNNGYYLLTDTGAITVKPGVTVTLDVKIGSFDLSSMVIQGGITNAGTVVAYQESGSLDLGGGSLGGAYNNRPENFVYFGLSGVTDITMHGNSTFYGVIYAPNADFKTKGGGSNTGFIGSLLVKSITVDGHFDLHYDESLVGYYWGYYVAGSWREL